MMKKILHFDKNAINEMEKRYRANFINSVTGYKSANLIGTISKDGKENLAIFSSVTHLGSNPALIGFILRPTTVPRHTYNNIKSTGIFTINHIHQSFIKNAHQTAASYAENVSEFDTAHLTPQHVGNFEAPFVQEAQVKFSCRYTNEYPIKENGTILIVGNIEDVYLPKDTLTSDGWIQLEKAESVTINGLDAYSSVQLIDRFSYAKPDKNLSSIK